MFYRFSYNSKVLRNTLLAQQLLRHSRFMLSGCGKTQMHANQGIRSQCNKNKANKQTSTIQL